jgi:hypothetical protein
MRRLTAPGDFLLLRQTLSGRRHELPAQDNEGAL